MDDNNNNQEAGGCCCQPLMAENETMKKMKPILIAGIIIYGIVGCLDTFYLRNYNLLSYALIVLFLCLMIFNRCFMAFQYYTIFSIILLFQVIIPKFGVPLQTNFKSDNAIGAFIIYLFTFIFFFFYFYFGFQAYKEMKYVFTNNMSNGPQLSTDFVGQNNCGCRTEDSTFLILAAKDSCAESTVLTMFHLLLVLATLDFF